MQIEKKKGIKEDIVFFEEDIDETKKTFETRTTNKKSTKIFAKWYYRVPILGNLVLKTQIRKGFFCADVVFRNQQVRRYVVSSAGNCLEIKCEGRIHVFDLTPISLDIDKYVKREDFIPVVQFYWDHPLPVPVKPTRTDILDLEMFGNEIIRQRSKASAQPIQQFLENAGRNIQMAMIFSLLSLVGVVACFAKLMGYF